MDKGLAQYRNERQAAAMIPLCGHLTEHVGQTRQGALVTGFELVGTAFEAKTEGQRGAYKESLNVWLRNVASPHLGLWSIMLRRQYAPDCDRQYPGRFAQQVNDRYRLLQKERPLYSNRLYLVLVLRVLGLRKAVSWSASKDQKLVREMIEAGIDDLEALASRVLAGLADYEPRRLGLYSYKPHVQNRFSELGELYANLLHGAPTDIPIGPYDLGQAIGSNRLLFGTEVYEARAPSGSRFGAALGIKEYVSTTYPEMFQPLLSLPFACNWVQSFLFVDKEKAKSEFAKQRRRLVSAGDEAVSQVDALEQALDDLMSNRFAAGEHNATLIPWADTAVGLQRNVAVAHAALSAPGLVVVREDIALQAHLFSTLPGCAELRPRSALVTTVNFASFSPFYCYPVGRAKGNHWGDAVTLFRSRVDTAVWFSPHVGDLGHTTVIGMSGAGKTALLAFLLAQFQRFPARHFILDKDRGLKLAVLALEGQYLSLEYGEPTGMNPFALPLTERHAAFLHDFVKLLAGGNWSAKFSKEVDEAIRSVYAMDVSQRRLRTVVHFLDATAEEGVAARLRPWVESGRFAWCFDNEEDTLRLGRLTGIDVTQFLEDATVRTPVSAYLLYRAEALIDGSPFVLWIDEFWRLLDDPYFESFVKDQLKTIRKKDGVVITATQSPADALKSSIAAAILEQTPTKLFLPNEYASEGDYCDGFKLTEAEWELFRPLKKSDRRFLLKQGGLSALIDFDLMGMDAEMRVLSGTEQRIGAADRLADAHGGVLPDNWLSILETEKWR